MTRFWNNIEKRLDNQTVYMSEGASKPKSPNRTAKISPGTVNLKHINISNKDLVI